MGKPAARNGVPVDISVSKLLAAVTATIVVQHDISGVADRAMAFSVAVLSDIDRCGDDQDKR